MSVAFERLIQHFVEHGFAYRVDEEREILHANFRGENVSTHIAALVEAEEDLFQVFGCIDTAVPQGALPSICEAIARANCGLKLGKFELNLSSGELRFQASTLLVAGTLDDQVIRRLIGTTLGMINRYLPAFMSVIYANEAPEDAIRRVEADLVTSRAE